MKKKGNKKVKVTTNRNKNKNQINININSNNKRRRAAAPRQPNNTSIIVSTPHVPYIPQDNGLNHIYPILQNIHEKVHQQSQPSNEDELKELRSIISNMDNTMQNMENTREKINATRNRRTSKSSGYASESDSEAGYNPLGFVSPRANKTNIPPTNLSTYKQSADFIDELGSSVVVKKRGRPKGSKNKPKEPKES